MRQFRRMASVSIDRIRVKIHRAKEHFGALEAELRAFLDAKPYVVGTKRDLENRRLIYYLVSVQDIPDRIAAITGDVIQNLRSALDHQAYALFMVGPGGTTGQSPRHIYFPIADDAQKYAAEAPAKVRGMRQDAIDAIDATKPYKGGNDTLWILHRLNNVDKHRFVIMVGSAFRSLDIGAHAFELFKSSFPQYAGAPTPHAFFLTADRMFPLKVGGELFIDGPNAEENREMQFRFEVAFGESGIIEGAPLVETLQGMGEVVDRLVTDFDRLLI